MKFLQIAWFKGRSESQDQIISDIIVGLLPLFSQAIRLLGGRSKLTATLLGVLPRRFVARTESAANIRTFVWKRRYRCERLPFWVTISRGSAELRHSGRIFAMRFPCNTPALQCPVVAVTDLPESYDYPHEVRFEIPERDLPAYRRAADFLNLCNADVLCVQHEFGIFGGQAGNYLLATLNEATCHAKNRVHCGPQDDHISAYTVLLSQALQAQSVSFPLFPQKIRLDRIPPDVHTFVAGQLGLIWDHSKHYAWNSRTRDVNTGFAQPTHLG